MKNQINELKEVELNLTGVALPSKLVEAKELINDKEVIGYGLLFKTDEKMCATKIVAHIKEQEECCHIKENQQVQTNVFGEREYLNGSSTKGEYNIVDSKHCSEGNNNVYYSEIIGRFSMSHDYTEQLFIKYPLSIGFNTKVMIVDSTSIDSMMLDIYPGRYDEIRSHLRYADLEKILSPNKKGSTSSKGMNRVLSYHFSSIIFDETNNTLSHLNYVVLIEKDCKLSYARLMTGFLDAIKKTFPQFKNRLKRGRSKLSTNQNKITLIGHLNGTDLANIYNYGKEYPNIFDSLQTKEKICYFTTRSLSPAYCWIKGGGSERGIKTALEIRDIMLLVDKRTTLTDLSKSFSLIEENQEEDEKRNQRLDHLLVTDMRSYIEKCSVGSTTILRWALHLTENNLSIQTIPYTISSAASDSFIQRLKTKKGWDDREYQKEFLSIESDFSRSTRMNKAKLSAERNLVEQCAIESFHGGRNEAFSHGLFTSEGKKQYLDIDIKSAYPISMCVLKNIDWQNVIRRKFCSGEFTEKNSLTTEMFKYDDIGFGRVDFEFPEDVLYPCLPVKSSTYESLIFPRKGTTYTAVSEIKLALELGAKVWISKGNEIIMINTTEDGDMADVMKEMIRERKKAESDFGKGSHQEKLKKLYANAIYGKMSQGISGRKYENQHEGIKKTGYGKITLPQYAAAATALIRCTVSYCMHVCQEESIPVHSVTTDGFIVYGEEEKVMALLLRKLKKNFPFINNALEDVFGEKTNAIEVKGRCKTLFNSRTRGNVSLEEGGMMAKGSHMTSLDFKKMPKKDQHQELFDLMVLREGPVLSEYHAVNIPNKSGEDHTLTVKTRRASFDYDFKRMINVDTVRNNQIVRNHQEYGYDSFFTQPFEVLEQYEKVHQYRDNYKNCINNKNEYDVIWSYYCHYFIYQEKIHFQEKFYDGSKDHIDYVSHELVKKVRKGEFGNLIANKSSQELHDIFSTECLSTVSFRVFNEWFKKGRNAEASLIYETDTFKEMQRKIQNYVLGEVESSEKAA